MANVISADKGTDKHYQHVGFTNTTTDSYASPGGTPWGITWDDRLGGSAIVPIVWAEYRRRREA